MINQADIIEAFNSASRYLLVDDLFNTYDIYYEQIADQIYPTELVCLLVLLMSLVDYVQ